VSVKPEQSRFTHTTGECLLRSNNSVSKKESASFEGRDLAWEASTLPLSYTRQNHIYFSRKNDSCKDGVLASSKSVTQLLVLIGGYCLCSQTACASNPL